MLRYRPPSPRVSTAILPASQFCAYFLYFLYCFPLSAFISGLKFSAETLKTDWWPSQTVKRVLSGQDQRWRSRGRVLLRLQCVHPAAPATTTLWTAAVKASLKSQPICRRASWRCKSASSEQDDSSDSVLLCNIWTWNPWPLFYTWEGPDSFSLRGTIRESTITPIRHLYGAGFFKMSEIQEVWKLCHDLNIK